MTRLRVFQLSRGVQQANDVIARTDILSTSKEYSHYEGMRKSHLDAVDEPIPRTLDDRKAIMKSRIEQQSVES